MDISDRKRLILAAVVALHSGSGDPVGSKSLANSLSQLSVSSATLRNEMSELTSMGLLEQPHTSAGRVPTARGVRFYIENLMNGIPLEESEKRAISAAVAAMDADPSRAAKESTSVLSDMFSLAAVASTPVGGDVQVIHYKLLRVGRYNVAVLAVTGAGSVLTRAARVSGELTDTELTLIEAVLNRSLAFVYRQDLTPSRLGMLSLEFGSLRDLAMPLLTTAVELLQETGHVSTYSEGQQYLLRYRELDGGMKELLEFFSDSRKIREKLERDPARVSVTVGSDLGFGSLENIAMVVSRYRAPGGRVGGLGIIGPARINYPYIIPRLRYFSEQLEQHLA